MSARRSSALARTKQRRSARGAAMVEALIVILSFVVLDVSLLYMHGAYSAKLTTMRDARRDVWASGLKACKGGSSGGTGGGGSDGSLSSLSGQVATAKTVAKGSTLTKPLDLSLSTGSATASGQADGQTSVNGAYQSLPVTTKSQLICNEQQQDISQGDIRQTINALYGSML